MLPVVVTDEEESGLLTSKCFELYSRFVIRALESLGRESKAASFLSPQSWAAVWNDRTLTETLTQALPPVPLWQTNQEKLISHTV